MHRRHPLIFASALGAVATSLLAAGCGGSSPTSPVARLGAATTTTQNAAGRKATGKYASALAYSSCMRSHGVPNFPDPQQTAGGGIQISGSQAGMNPQSPAFESAQQSCRRLLPNGGQPTHADQEQALGRLLHAAHCMRAHGIAWFPDPALTAPANRAGHSALMNNDGVWLAIPDSVDIRSPAFKQAARACNLALP